MFVQADYTFVYTAVNYDCELNRGFQ